MKDGGSVYMADKIILPVDAVQASGWYARRARIPTRSRLAATTPTASA